MHMGTATAWWPNALGRGFVDLGFLSPWGVGFPNIPPSPLCPPKMGHPMLLTFVTDLVGWLSLGGLGLDILWSPSVNRIVWKGLFLIDGIIPCSATKQRICACFTYCVACRDLSYQHAPGGVGGLLSVTCHT